MTADFCYRLQVCGRRNHGTEGCPAHRFKDECGRGSLGGIDGSFEFGYISLSAIAASIRAIERATIAVRHANVRELPDHRHIDFASALVPRDRQGTHRRTVIALCAAQDLVPARLPDFYVVLPGEFQRCFDRLRASAGEINRAAFEVLAG